MNILVACEESQAVTIELRRLGHNAFSCDIQDCSGGHPEWHIKGDVVPLLHGRCAFQTMDGQIHKITDRWGMIIGFPPCTKTSNAGARHLYRGVNSTCSAIMMGCVARHSSSPYGMQTATRLFWRIQRRVEYLTIPLLRRRYSHTNTAIPSPRKPCYGREAWNRSSQLVLLPQREHGVHLEVIPESIIRDIVECSLEIELGTGPKPSLGSLRPWRSSGPGISHRRIYENRGNHYGAAALCGESHILQRVSGVQSGQRVPGSASCSGGGCAGSGSGRPEHSYFQRKQVKRLKAWLVKEKDEFCATVVFAETRGKARALARSTEVCEDTDFTDILVYRRPALDKYYVPGKKEMDWFNSKDRIALVKDGGFTCSPEYWEPEDCDACPAAEYCDTYADRIREREECLQ